MFCVCPDECSGSPPLHNIYIFVFRAAEGLETLAGERGFPFCRFLGRGREGAELLLTRNFKRKPCIIDPGPCSC